MFRIGLSPPKSLCLPQKLPRSSWLAGSLPACRSHSFLSSTEMSYLYSKSCLAGNITFPLPSPPIFSSQRSPELCGKAGAAKHRPPSRDMSQRWGGFRVRSKVPSACAPTKLQHQELRSSNGPCGGAMNGATGNHWSSQCHDIGCANTS